MNSSAIIGSYRRIYRKLYNRDPKELHDLGSGWVLVNGARMQAAELARLTEQMQNEYRQMTAYKRNVVQRLLSFSRDG